MDAESQCKKIGRVARRRKDVFGHLKITIADLEEDVRLEELCRESRHYSPAGQYLNVFFFFDENQPLQL